MPDQPNPLLSTPFPAIRINVVFNRVRRQTKR
jgi:hypothetical protein